ncbi:junctional adhesion molecule-like [Channa argus]|uniref:junctional adhesion molecule-like n=1 Tax=Channa argus TaxID=215402 RepID=UPI00351F9FB2
MDQLTTLSFTFLALVTLTNASEEMRAKAGKDVSLDCVGNTQVPIEAIKWIKPNLKSDLYVYFYRDDVFYKDFLLPSFQNRTEMKDPMMKGGDVSLILKKVSIDDAGEYECHVSLKNTTRKRAYSDLWCVVNLTVVVPQQIITNPGDNVTLPCQGSRNISIAAVQWIRPELHDPVYLHRNEPVMEPHDQEVRFVKRVKLKDRQMKDGDMSLVLMNVQASDTGTYECHRKWRVVRQQKRTLLKSEPISIVKLIVTGKTPGQIWDTGSNVFVGLAVCQLVCFLLV